MFRLGAFMGKRLGVTAAVLLGAVGVANAADLPTSKPAPPPPPTLASCTGVTQFFTTNCPLTYYGITIYGTVDMGLAYQSWGTPFNRDAPFGLEYLVQKNSNRSQFTIAPNGLSQSFIGVKATEPLFGDLSFVFNWQMGFDPYSLRLSNGPLSQEENNGLPLNLQNTNADSSRAGQWYNGALYAGLSSKTFGTLTFGRQNSLTLDGVNAYDPMGGSYAFSVIGFSGATAGVGDTEDTRYSTALKYRVDFNQFRFGALYDFGGYAWNNADTSAWQIQIGGDFGNKDYGKLSLDAIYSRVNDAVSLSALSAAQNLLFPGTLAATISDNQSWMFLAKYSLGPWKLYGGYENILFEPPSNPQTGFTSIANIFVPTGFISNTTYTVRQKDLQVMWTGVKYAFSDTLDISGGYYHYNQDNFNTTPAASCKGSGQAQASSCAGTLNALSAMVDWRFSPKFDLYGGLMYSIVGGGLASGYLHNSSIDPMAGLRFTF
jgi:predicted porin